MKRRAIVYIRVSTDEQAEKGYSLQHQLERLSKYCEINNIEIVQVFNEDFSAKTFNRPEFQKILILLKSRKLKADMLLFTKWDRFSRNAGDAYGMINTLTKLGVEPQALEQPLDLNIPENKIMLAVYLAAPEVENDRRALNVIVGMRRARKEGRWMTKAPLGYRNTLDSKNKKIIEPDENAPTVKWIFEQIGTGVHNVVEVWKMAREKGLDSCKNNIWLLIRNPVYCGKIVVQAYKDEPLSWAQGTHTPLISEELFYKVQDVLDGRKRNVPTKNTKKDELLLRGFLICRKCGQLITGSASKGNGGRYVYYHCRKGCNERFKADVANDLFIKGLSQTTPPTDALDAFKYVIKQTFSNNEQDKTQQLIQIRNQIAKVQERINNAQSLMLDGDINAIEYKEIKNRLTPEIEKLNRQLADTSAFDSSYNTYVADGVSLLGNLAQAFIDGDLYTKHQIIGSIFPEKLTFENNQYRTIKLLDAHARMLSFGTQFRGKKKGTQTIFVSESTQVAGDGFEPTPFPYREGYETNELGIQ